MRTDQARFTEVAEAMRVAVSESGLDDNDQLLVFTANAGALLCDYMDGEFNEDLATKAAELVVNAYSLACHHFNKQKTLN